MTKVWITANLGDIPTRSDAAPWDLHDVTIQIDRLQALAEKSPFGIRIWEKKGLGQWKMRGVDGLLASRLGHHELPKKQKLLLLDLARVLGASKVAAVLERMIESSTDDIDVRLSASYVLLRGGGTKNFDRLAEFVRHATPSTTDERAIVSNIILGLLENCNWTFQDAFCYTPGSETGYGDASTMLEIELKKRMTVSDARWLLSSFDWHTQTCQLSRNKQRQTPIYLRHRHGALSFAIHAVDMLLAQSQIPQSDLLTLGSMLLLDDPGYDLHYILDRITPVIRQDRKARRAVFLLGLTEQLENGSWRWRHVLLPEDAEWLLGVQQVKETNWLLMEALRLARNSGNTNLAEEVQTRVNEIDSNAVESFNARLKAECEEWERYQREREERLKSSKRQSWTIAEAVQETIELKDISDKEKLCRLALICFEASPYRPEDIIGQFEDLPEHIRQCVLRLCAETLKNEESTQIPLTSSYLRTIHFEASAFMAVVRGYSEYHLDGDEIRKWLPAVLLITWPDRSDILERCFAVDSNATEDVLAATFRREAHLDGRAAVTASNLANAHWSDRLIELTLAILRQQTVPIDGRCALLGAFARGAPSAIVRVAEEWLEQAISDSTSRFQIQVAAIDALLLCAPDTAVPHLARAFDEFGLRILKNIRALQWRPGEPELRLGSWSAISLEALTIILQRALPPERDPIRARHESVQITNVEELRRLRDLIPRILFERSELEDGQALERLKDQFQSIRDFISDSVSMKEVSSVLQSGLRPEGAIKWQEVVRLLDYACYRLIRTASDLQDVLVDELSQIGLGATEHLSMLYRPRPTKKGERRGNLNEDALQAYLYCRLSDRLASRVLGETTSVVLLNRETLASFDRKLDFKVQAPTVDGICATVIVEVKWSTNKSISTSLYSQLGESYLVKNDVSHGIYFVGWVGKGTWSKQASGKKPQDLESQSEWMNALRKQAELFSAEHPNKKIVPMMVDLRWQRATDA